MSRTLSLAAIAILAVFISSDRAVQAAAPTTQPDLAAENATLKQLLHDYISKNDMLTAKLKSAEDENAELHAKLRDLSLKALQQKLTDATRSLSTPYRLAPLTPSAPQQIPNTRSFSFNGQTVYLVPLAHDDILSSVAPNPAAGTYQLTRGTLIDDRTKP